MALQALQALQALLRPDRYFGERAPNLNLGHALLVAFLVALVTTAAFGAFGWILSQQLTATTEIPNENRPPDWVCDGEADTEAEEMQQERCDQPKTEEVVVGSLVWEMVTDKIPLVFVGVLLGWPLNAIGLHLASALVGGEGSFVDTLSVAAWGMVPTAVQGVVALGWVTLSLGSLDLAASDPEVFASQMESLFERAQGQNALLSLAAACWQGYVWTFGLKHARRLPVGAAAFAGGGVAVVVFLFGLV